MRQVTSCSDGLGRGTLGFGRYGPFGFVKFWWVWLGFGEAGMVGWIQVGSG